MRTLCLVSALVVCSIGAAQEERKTLSLFQPLAVKDLKENEKKIYDRIKAKKTTVNIDVYRLNNIYGAAEFAKVVDIRFTMFKEDIEILGCTSKKGVITLEKEGRNFVVLTVKEASATGLIYYGKKVYSVEPLGDFRVAISEIDQTKFPKD